MRVTPTVRGVVPRGRRDQVRVAAAWSLLGCFRLLICVAPFTLVRRLLGRDHGPAAVAPSADLTPAQMWRARRIAEVVQHAAARTPWTSDCYPQALTARTFLALRRIPHAVDFGVRRESGELRAHAWVRAGRVAVTGGNGAGWTRVASFAWSPR